MSGVQIPYRPQPKCDLPNYRMVADIIIDLQYGDCGKGKISHYLTKKGSYTHVLRFNGGPNAGHTIYHNKEKFVTHHIPSGIFFGIKSVIGPGCVVNPVTFLQEVKMMENKGIRIKGKLFIAKNTHVITEAHLREDAKDSNIGTTKTGNGPAYRDKHARVGKRAEDIPQLKPYLIDLYEEFYGSRAPVKVLCEGAQAFGLDIDWGDYPYVTSSHTTVAGALLNGIAHQSVKNVWGVAKVYETYVGNKKFEGKDKIFNAIREYAQEFGATTGRPRQVNWLDINLLKQAILMNGVTHVVFNKADILRDLKVWKVRDGKKIIAFKTEKSMQTYLKKLITKLGVREGNIYFSYSKETL